MYSISMDDTPFLGTSRSFTHQVGLRRPVACSSCGSSLTGRFERRRTVTIAGIRTTVDVFRCRCGRGRWVRPEAVSR
jgi:hypothetical protein